MKVSLKAMKILILGATGAAGGSLFDLALSSTLVSEVRTISRRAVVTGSPKHVGFLHQNLLDYTLVSEAFASLDACFFCVGRAVTQVRDEAEYRTLVRSFAEAAARALRSRSPGAIFHYLSGQGANPASRQMWARVKAEAERVLIDEYEAVCWRPGAIDAKRTSGWPAFYRVVIPALRIFAPSRRFYVTGDALARAMLIAAATKARARIIENLEIRRIAEEDHSSEQEKSATAGPGQETRSISARRPGARA